MRVHAFQAECQFVGDGLSAQCRTGRQQGFHRGRRGHRAALSLQPVGVAATGSYPGNVDQVLYGERQSAKRA